MNRYHSSKKTQNHLKTKLNVIQHFFAASSVCGTDLVHRAVDQEFSTGLCSVFRQKKRNKVRVTHESHDRVNLGSLILTVTRKIIRRICGMLQC